ncbi:archaemetzincin-2 isoform X1 [Microcaecilia unicolor]|uniref:Archaemetzincin-2 n=1 Tax=Microcaecilia unicolor TaxID=1415580 RepID=A0A6P7YMH4_9AMPH|nr:archaemetzincin-2 isoform X1 [Microcaecilia unicolor]
MEVTLRREQETKEEMQVIRHSEQALKTALISKNGQLIKLYEKLSQGERRLLNEAFRPDSVLFQPISVHSESDWIPSHPEPTQDFEQFYQNPYRSTPSAKRSIIYVQPIGSFGDSRVTAEDYLHWLKSYCEAFYYGLAVKILQPIPVSSTSCAFRVNEHTHNLQIHAEDLLKFLKQMKPKDAFCIVGLTMIDLYPKESWNFVFGQASLTEGMGIFSFARYDSDFYSRNYKGRLKPGKKLTAGDYSVFDGYYTPPVTSTLLLRSCKTLTHELGHIFGLRHCQWLQCVMQGSNHLEESDRRPPELCPICLRKLHCALGFNIAERYKALLHWIDGGGCGVEDPGCSHKTRHSPKAVEDFKEHRGWILKCLDLLQQ